MMRILSRASGVLIILFLFSSRTAIAQNSLDRELTRSIHVGGLERTYQWTHQLQKKISKPGVGAGRLRREVTAQYGGYFPQALYLPSPKRLPTARGFGRRGSAQAGLNLSPLARLPLWI
jgi:hypothetical protein